MSDKEILELAAKAAGIDAHWGDGWQSDMMFRALPRPNSPLVAYVEWNPITDDGDALRLAVKLAIDFKIRNGATWWDYLKSDGFVYWGHGHEPHNGDPLGATRRAIVRAAAEIGRQMP